MHRWHRHQTVSRADAAGHDRDVYPPAHVGQRAGATGHISESPLEPEVEDVLQDLEEIKVFERAAQRQIDYREDPVAALAVLAKHHGKTVGAPFDAVDAAPAPILLHSGFVERRAQAIARVVDMVRPDSQCRAHPSEQLHLMLQPLAPRGNLGVVETRGRIGQCRKQRTRRLEQGIRGRFNGTQAHAERQRCRLALRIG
ncbi:hypothetical protein WT15_06750 [Burkholderia stagnalis]|nr:hypothetical protein WT74_23055 [Burkholderia stagnalis]KVN84587.1 hypothetical protein WT15_06750 [Burkholderia stagnalis]KWO33284.1 hypothetical protein WT95_13705 [Burkholderia stagnalis]